MSSSNCCFSTCIQISQEAGQVVWYSHLFQNFPQFLVIHTVKGFGIINKAEVDAFLELSAFSMIQRMLVIWSLVPLPFLNPAWTSGSSCFTYCWNLAWRIFEHYFASVWDECNYAVVWGFFGIAFLWDWNKNWPISSPVASAEFSKLAGSECSLSIACRKNIKKYNIFCFKTSSNRSESLLQTPQYPILLFHGIYKNCI